MWFALAGDERITKRCATKDCGGQPTWRLEADGVGSDYCSGCKLTVSEQDAMRRYRFQFFDGSVFVGDGVSTRDALIKLGLGAYNPVAYEVTDITKDQKV